jgi:glycosyltransferase involved in cell wall biosynthesis
MIVAGLFVTTLGYLRVRLRPRDVTASARTVSPTIAGEGRLRVLMVTPRSPLLQGGVERHVMEVSRRMAAAGVDVEVLCSDPEVRRTESVIHEGVPIHIVPAYPRERDYYLAPQIWSQIPAGRWDLIHVQSYHTLVAPLAMARALRLGVPYVVTFHGGGHSSALRNRARGPQMTVLRPLLRRAARLVAVAKFEIDEYGAALGVPRDRFALIPNGTETSFAASEVQTAEPANPVLATIGRLERYKGHHRVLAAFPRVLAERPDARLLIVGSGPYEEELRRQAEQLGVADRVEITSVPSGDAGAMVALLEGVSLVVLMSEFETHPLVALEAAAARRRLLVADHGGLGELVGDGFARGIPLDSAPERIAAAALEELEKPLPDRSPALTSWDDCAASLIALYRTII